jgi:hypothetical protein
MARHAPLLALLLLQPIAVAAEETPGRAVPVTAHETLSRPIPMAVVGSSFVQAGTAPAFFSGLEAAGYACMAEDVTRWRVRRVLVTCARGGERLVYEGGFGPERGSVTFDRVSRDGVLLGGRELATHARTAAARPEGAPRALAEAAPPGR